MKQSPPKYFQPWDISLLPDDACCPLLFKEVRIWRDGETEIVNPVDVKGPIDDLYWQPLDAPGVS